MFPFVFYFLFFFISDLKEGQSKAADELCKLKQRITELESIRYGFFEVSIAMPMSSPVVLSSVFFFLCVVDIYIFYRSNNLQTEDAPCNRCSLMQSTINELQSQLLASVCVSMTSPSNVNLSTTEILCA